ncbi:TPA: CDP-diacylglycerol diphosphatase [Pseudomonas aeruginosa]|nr:CDP-diacylglycerol diphosphatase [Pseudomonas aeruginosa]HEE6759658.1 CDP-diacylglycerol diphosphatase [Pseudomonas aeruginosa]
MKKLMFITSVILLSVGWFFFSRGDLYRNVKSSCDSLASNRQCLKVDVDNSYYIFKDRKGKFHNLLVPMEKISGIESGRLYFNGSNFFYNAWRDRSLLKLEGVKDETIYGMAINSRYGRSQDQLHIHFSCLKPSMHKLLSEKNKGLYGQWTKLSLEKEGQEFDFVKISYFDFKSGAVFPLVFGFSVNNKISLERIGVGVVVWGGDVFVLIRVADLGRFEFASVGDILDYSCSLAGKS